MERGRQNRACEPRRVAPRVWSSRHVGCFHPLVGLAEVTARDGEWESTISRAVFRVDASTRIGIGHLARCMRLARELQRYGVQCEFARRGPVDSLSQEFATSWMNSDVFGLNDGETERRQLNECHKDVGEQDADANEFLKQLEPYSSESCAVVVDHYCLDVFWEKRIAPAVTTLVVIDDLANRKHHCDILVDSAPLPAARYANLVAATSSFLIGPEFALLDRTLELPPQQCEVVRQSQKPRVLATFGGSRNDVPVRLLLDAVEDLVTTHFDLDVVLPASVTSALRRDLESAGASVHGWRPDLPLLVAAAQLAVSAGGSTVFECVRAGTPAITIATASNQVAFAQAWNNLGLTRHLGGLDTVSTGDLRRAILDALNDTSWRDSVRMQAGTVVDGRGAQRVASRMCGLREAGPLR